MLFIDENITKPGMGGIVVTTARQPHLLLAFVDAEAERVFIERRMVSGDLPCAQSSLVEEADDLLQLEVSRIGADPKFITKDFSRTWFAWRSLYMASHRAMTLTPGVRMVNFMRCL